MAIPNGIVFANGKGGVLKTTAASHLAGYAAASGWDVLVVDADAQANQSRDLGYVPDGGVALARALTGSDPLKVTRHPKWPTLSYVSGGRTMEDALGITRGELSKGKVGAMRTFEAALAAIAGEYHLVVVDSPPGELLLRKMLFVACRFVVVPCQVDVGSIDGIAGVLETVGEVRNEGLNPDLEVLGAFLGPIQTGATKTERLARRRINELVGDQDFVLAGTIRAAQSIAAYCRDHGVLVNEYEVLAAADKASERRHWWRQSPEERARAREEHTFSAAASGLAADWQHLTEEIMERFTQRREVLSTSGLGGVDHGSQSAQAVSDV